MLCYSKDIAATNQPGRSMNANHWAEPSAPDQAEEAMYQQAHALREHALREAEVDAGLVAGIEMQSRWDSIYRAAVCSAAEAIAARDWAAKRAAMVVAQQADGLRDRVTCAIFGGQDVPAAYAAYEAAGARISREQSSAALRAIAADDRAAAAQRKVPRAPIPRRDPATIVVRQADRAAAAKSVAAAVKAAAELQAKDDVAAGHAALSEVISTALGGADWVECGGVILADDGRTFARPVWSDSTAADVGRALRTRGYNASLRSGEIARWAQMLPLRAAA